MWRYDPTLQMVRLPREYPKARQIAYASALLLVYLFARAKYGAHSDGVHFIAMLAVFLVLSLRKSGGGMMAPKS